jgi:hypothetical protein
MIIKSHNDVEFYEDLFPDEIPKFFEMIRNDYLIYNVKDAILPDHLPNPNNLHIKEAIVCKTAYEYMLKCGDSVFFMDGLNQNEMKQVPKLKLDGHDVFVIKSVLCSTTVINKYSQANQHIQDQIRALEEEAARKERIVYDSTTCTDVEIETVEIDKRLNGDVIAEESVLGELIKRLIDLYLSNPGATVPEFNAFYSNVKMNGAIRSKVKDKNDANRIYQAISFFNKVRGNGAANNKAIEVVCNEYQIDPKLLRSILATRNRTKRDYL